jgi:hypothetical protein
MTPPHDRSSNHTPILQTRWVACELYVVSIWIPILYFLHASLFVRRIDNIKQYGIATRVKLAQRWCDGRIYQYMHAPGYCTTSAVHHHRRMVRLPTCAIVIVITVTVIVYHHRQLYHNTTTYSNNPSRHRCRALMYYSLVHPRPRGRTVLVVQPRGVVVGQWWHEFGV